MPDPRRGENMKRAFGERRKMRAARREIGAARAGNKGEEAMVAKADPIERLIEQENWTEARRRIEEELKGDPENHWLLTRLSTTYYEQGDYAQALHWVEKAREFAPNCPLVRWDYAGTLDMLGREREAIGIYRSLLQQGAEGIAADECGEGAVWAQGLLTDCVYRAGRCLEDLGDRRKAADLYGIYLNLVDMGAPSIYPREEAVGRLRKLPGQRRLNIERSLERAGRELVDA